MDLTTQLDVIKPVHMLLLNKALRLALRLVSSFFRYTYCLGNKIIVTPLLDKAKLILVATAMYIQ